MTRWATPAKCPTRGTGTPRIGKATSTFFHFFPFGFGQSLTRLTSSVYMECTTRAPGHACCALRVAHADRMPIGACDPMFCGRSTSTVLWLCCGCAVTVAVLCCDCAVTDLCLRSDALLDSRLQVCIAARSADRGPGISQPLDPGAFFSDFFPPPFLHTPANAPKTAPLPPKLKIKIYKHFECLIDPLRRAVIIII